MLTEESPPRLFSGAGGALLFLFGVCVVGGLLWAAFPTVPSYLGTGLTAYDEENRPSYVERKAGSWLRHRM